MTNKILLVFLLSPTLMVNAQEDFGRGETFRKEVITEVHNQLRLCDFEDDFSISEVKTTHETFQICEFTDVCDPGTYFKIYKAGFYEAPDKYQELYFTKRDTLIFARETKLSIFGNDTIIWSCDYFFEKGALVDFSSLGHGKTEEEDWNPESIITQFKERLGQQ